MITTVTLNASIDKAYHMDRDIENGTVMRVASCNNTAGGKGLNVARIIKLCGADVNTTGFCGGYNGKYLESLLEKDGLPHCFVHVAEETRCCLNILDEKYGSTEYLEPGCHISAKEEAEFMALFEKLAGESGVITLSGSLPKGVEPDIYARLIVKAKEKGTKVILDSSGRSLEEGLKACPTLVKPNQEEMELLLQTKINHMEDVITCAKKIYDTGIPYVVVSLGGEGALLICEEGMYHGRPPKISVINTVGCGDSMVGAFAVALEKELPAKEALKEAVAVATANAMNAETGNFRQEDYEKVIREITIETL